MAPVRACADGSLANALRAPRSLKLPVLWRCSCLQKIRAPVNSLSAADSMHGVRKIAPFRRDRAATISDSETLVRGSVFIGLIWANKNPELLTQGFGIERCRIPALVYSCPKRGAIMIAAMIMLG